MPITLVARETAFSEVELVVEYFHRPAPEHLDLLGVDPTRLPIRANWIGSFTRNYSLPIERRRRLYVTWLSEDHRVGLSSCDKVVFGERANMHIHVPEAERRNQGVGTTILQGADPPHSDEAVTTLLAQAGFERPTLFFSSLFWGAWLVRRTTN